MTRFWLACVSAWLCAGCGPDGFACESDGQCGDGELLGTCEASGFCSFPDATCESGRRYGEHAPDDLADSCVDAAAESVNLVHNPSCDDGTSGWGTHLGLSLDRSDIARTGSGSCRVCVDAGVGNATLDDAVDPVASGAAGGTYVASAWVRAETTSAGATAYLALRETDSDVDTSPEVQLDQTWHELRLEHTMSAQRPLDMFIDFASATGGCFLADDLSLHRRP